MTRKTKRAVGTESLPMFAEAPFYRGSVPASRRTDPQTSHAAGESMVEEAKAQRAAILSYLETHSGGATADALDRELAWRPSTAGRRLSELIEMGQVMRCDGLPQKGFRPPKLTQKTRQGRYAHIHVHISHVDPTWRVE